MRQLQIAQIYEIAIRNRAASQQYLLHGRKRRTGERRQIAVAKGDAPQIELGAVEAQVTCEVYLRHRGARQNQANENGLKLHLPWSCATVTVACLTVVLPLASRAS